ncbi:HIT-like protein [Lactarius sanguifluus]|nr:HIT-like protein [Lactarius sanguifluus]
MTSSLKVLRTYAKLSDPSITALPPTVYFSHTPNTRSPSSTPYPKALFHFLVLPRLSNDDDERSSDLMDLRTLLRGTDAARAGGRGCARLRGVVRRRGDARVGYGFAWDSLRRWSVIASFIQSVLIFAPPSSRQTKRHYNSFSPRAGFFVPLAEVRTWFNDAAAPPQLAKVRRLAPEEYEPCLKYALECFRCMPALKKHLQLQDEFDALRKREGKSKKHRREAEVRV